MAVEVHVDAVVQRGRFADFLGAAERWRQFRKERGWCVPRVLAGMSGTMNAVRFIFAYEHLADYEREEAVVSADREYARVAMAMPFDGPIEFTIFQEASAASTK